MLIKEVTDSEYIVEKKNNLWRYPRVTKVIRTVFDGIQIGSATHLASEDDYVKFDGKIKWVSESVMDRAQEFGKAVHAACQYWNNGTLKEETLDPNVRLYLNGYIKFRREVPWAKKILLNEQKVIAGKFGYGGTLDNVFVSKVLVDIKTGVINKLIGLQLHAYKNAVLEQLKIKIKKCFAIKLIPNDYRLFQFDDIPYFSYFTSVLNVYNLAQRKDLLKEGG